MLDGYIGQEDRLEALKAAINARRHFPDRPMPHMLFLGGSGRGKTRLAQEVARATGKDLVVLHAPSVSQRNEIAAKLIEAEGNILFIDEVHSLPRMFAEDLYLALDENRINIEVPQAAITYDSRYLIVKRQLPESMRDEWRGMGFYDIPVISDTGMSKIESKQLRSVTVIGATTDEALLPAAFLSRLSALKVYLRPYTVVELATIGTLHAESIGYVLAPEAAVYLAERSRGTPRRMLHLVERSADFTGADKMIYSNVASMATKALGVDSLGLEQPHRAILEALAASPNGLSRTSLGQRLGLTPKNLTLYWGDLLEQNLVTIGTRHEILLKGVEALDEWKDANGR